MAKTTPAGTKAQYASAFGTTLSITAATNATSCVVTVSSAATLAVGDYVQIVTSGWSSVVGGVWRISAISANNVTLEGLDTSSTIRYPAGQGTGSLRKVTWADIPNLARDGTSITPGEPRFVDASNLNDLEDRQLPDGASTARITLSTHYDPALTAFATLRSYSDSQALIAARLVHPAGDIVAFGCYVYVPILPTLQAGQTRRLNIDLTQASVVTTYTS